MNRPLVSIGFPVYNGEESVGRALDSILSQDFEDYEIVIADNASTDRTAAVCQEYASRDRRVRYFRNEANIGVNPNHDRVFALSEGQYFTWFAHDLRYLSGMLRKCVGALRQAPPSVVLLYPRCEVVRDGVVQAPDGRPPIACADPRPHRRLRAVIRNVYLVNQLFGLMPREALGRTRLNGPYAGSDCVLLAELAMQGEIRELPETLVQRRIDAHRGTAAVLQDQRRWKAWLDPNHRGTWRDRLGYRGRMALEYFCGAWGSPLPLREKLRCLPVAGGQLYWELLLTRTGPARHALRRWVRGGGATPSLEPKNRS